ncbi:hypothetical protein GPECTOR_528g523 [Gonium pectorale]|uniref:Reverse transcriptase domain-containing protein n=1 Tax=Gonium pectorale TaxID=33097 RepID=A0A150FUP3_GONPE|nr:hypothetical protein GPECTOR_528g523 [Gonium pectorale]|eukprot:KXZ41351.1 hypothetical protein GPECTOR_528g523 [Gonium pectorale]
MDAMEHPPFGVTPSSLNSIPLFQAPGDDPRQWLEAIERHAGVFGWTDANKLAVARCRLGAGAQVWESGTAHNINTWVAFKRAFLSRFAVPEDELYTRLANCKQARREAVRSYADRYRDLVAQLGLDTNRDPTYMYNFLRGLHGDVYDKVYLLRPHDLESAIELSIYVSETRHSKYDGGYESGDERYDRPLPATRHVRFERPNPTERYPDVRRDDREERRDPPPPRFEPEGRGKNRWEDRRPPNERRQDDRRQDDRRQDRPVRPPPRFERQAPSAPARSRSSLEDQMAELGEQLSKLSLNFRSMAASRDPAANLYDPYDQGLPAAHLMEVQPVYGGHPEVYNRDEVYTKRIGDFEPANLPRKRQAADPGQTAPRTTTPSGRTSMRAAVPRQDERPTSEPMRPASRPGEAPPRASPAAAGSGGAAAASGAARQSAPTRTGWRPIRAPGEPSGRTDAVPADPQEEERKLAEEIVNKVNRYTVPLSTTLRCNTVNVYAKVGSRILGMARQHGRQAAAAPGTTPLASNTYERDPSPELQPVGPPRPTFQGRRTTITTSGPGVTTAAAWKGGRPTPAYQMVPIAAPKFQVTRASVLVANAVGDFEPVQAVVDSGASHSVISRMTLRKLGLLDSIETTSVTFLNADGRRAPAAGVVRGLLVSTGDMAIMMDVYVSNATNYGILLGTDFMHPIGADLDFKRHLLKYDNDENGRGCIAIEVVRQDAPAMSAEVQDQSEASQDSDVSDPEAYLLMDDEAQQPAEEEPQALPIGRLTALLLGALDPAPRFKEESVLDFLEIGGQGQRGLTSFAGAGGNLPAPEPMLWNPSSEYGSSPEPLETSEEMPGLMSSDEEEEDWGWHETDDQGTQSDGSNDPWDFYEAYNTTMRFPSTETLSEAATALRESRHQDAYMRGQVAGRTHAEHLAVATENGRHARAKRDAASARAGPSDELRSLLLSKVNPELEEAERLAITGCLLANYDLFALSNSELGCTPWASMKVDTGDAPPVFTPPYRMSKVEREAVDKEIQRMLADGIIEPSTSAWSSPVVVVPKRDTGELRFCVDMRRINEVTRTVRYPLGHIQDILDRVAPPAGQTRYYSCLDLKSGFWQVPMADDASKDRVSFHTASSQWRYKVMPMGLKNSPAVFAELMRRVLAPVLPGSVAMENPGSEVVPPMEPCAMVYLDDIIIYSADIVSHVTHLQQVFDLLRLASLKAAVKKCVFGQQRIHFLGHVLDGVNGTLAPSPRNVAVIASYPSPHNVRQVRALLGTVGYYRSFVPGFSLVAKPLFELLKKDAPWRWGDAEETAFQTLKTALTNEPILRAPDFGRPFFVQTD